MNLSNAETLVPVVPRYLLDTNLLLRVADVADAQHATASAALASLAMSTALFHIAPQNLIEFWVAATRPVAVNGLAKTTAEAAAFLQHFQSNFRLLPDTAAIYGEWQRLVTSYGVSGKPAHDARLVAFMRVHSLTHLLTFNAAHFHRFAAGEGIAIVDPAQLSLKVL